MGIDFGGIVLIALAIAIAAVIVYVFMKRRAGADKEENAVKIGNEPPARVSDALEGADAPRIVVTYERDGGLLEDGKCGWLDLESEEGEKATHKLNFNKKSPEPIIIPLKPLVYRITYRTQSKAAMLASGALRAINEGNGAMGAFANAVSDVSGMSGKFGQVCVRVCDGFVLRLVCTTDGLTKSCRAVLDD